MATSEGLTPLRAGDTQTYVVAGGNHVTVLLDRAHADGILDVIQVRAVTGGGPPSHRHSFAEWFRVLDGELTMREERDGVMRTTSVLRAGDSIFVAPWVWHGTLNLGTEPCRFEVVGQPAEMSGYFAEAGVVADGPEAAPASEPPGPDVLGELAARWGIEFWTGPTESA
jgi:mannose-6-phosphate isomerase-like protein (cupin superfamily)